MNNTELARAIIEGDRRIHVVPDEMNRGEIVIMGFAADNNGTSTRKSLSEFLHELLIERSVLPHDLDRLKFYATHGLAASGQKFDGDEQVKTFKAITDIEKLTK